MRVLFVAPYPPSRIRVRAYGFVRHLAAHHEVHVLALAGNPRDNDDANRLGQEGVSVRLIEDGRASRLRRTIQALATQTPLQVAYAASPRLSAAIAGLLQAQRFDVLHVESLRALDALPKDLPVPVVWDAVDCVTRLFEQGARAAATLQLRLIGHLEAQRTRAYEGVQLRRFRQILVTSERDRQALLDLAACDDHRAAGATSSAGTECADISVIAHGIDLQYFHPFGGPRQPATLVFSGKMGFHANVAGALALVHDILPRVWAVRPDTRLIIAGSDPPRAVRNLARDPRIRVTGFVADLRDVIGHAQVAVSPLPYAVGIQNKVLEAMALGTPVVASTAAAAGLQTLASRDLLVADTPDAFAAAVLHLLSDANSWHELSARGLAYIESHHNWDRVMHQLLTVYERARAAPGTYVNSGAHTSASVTS